MAQLLFDQTAFNIRDSCSSRLAVAKLAQEMVRYKREIIPAFKLYGTGSARASNISINTTHLRELVTECHMHCPGRHRTVSCRVLSDLLDAKLSGAINVTLRSLARHGSTGRLLSSEEQADHLLSNQPATDIVILPISSREVQAISPVFSVFNVLHMGYWPSSPIFANTNEYPGFFRVNPTDEFQVKAIGDLLEDLGVRYAILLAGDDDFYSGEAYRRLLRESITRLSFCFALRSRISTDSHVSITTAVHEISKLNTSRVIVLYATLEQAQAFFDVYLNYNISTNHVFIGSDDWVNRMDYFQWSRDSKLHSIRIFGFGPDPQLFFPKSNFTVFRDLEQHLQNPATMLDLASRDLLVRQVYEHEQNCSFGKALFCLLQHKWLHHARNCTSPDMSTAPVKQLSLAKVMVFMFEVFAQLYRAQSVIQPACDSRGICQLLTWRRRKDGKKFLAEYKLPCRRHQGKRRMCHVFSESQSGYPGYELRTVIAGQSGPELTGVALWDGQEGTTYRSRLTWYNETCVEFAKGTCINMWLRRPEHRPDRRMSSANQILLQSTCTEACPSGSYIRLASRNPYLFCCWQCLSCPDGEVSEKINSNQCRHCENGTIPSRNKSQCIHRILSTPESVSRFVYATLSVGVFSLCFTVFAIRQVFIHRDRRVFKATSFPLIGAILAVSTFTHIYTCCVIVPMPITVSWCRVYGALGSILSILLPIIVLAKLEVVSSCVHAMLQLMRIRTLSLPNDKKAYGHVLVTLVLSIAICLILLAAYALSPIQVETRDFDLYFVKQVCVFHLSTSVMHSVISVCTLTVSTVLAYRGRYMDSEYSNAYLVLIWSATALCWEIINIISGSVLLRSEFVVPGILLYNVVQSALAVTVLILPRICWAYFGYKRRLQRPHSLVSKFNSSAKSNSSAGAACGPTTVLRQRSQCMCVCACQTEHSAKPPPTSCSQEATL